MGEPLEGWLVASKRLGPLPRIKRGALGRGCGREGSGALPLASAAAVSTGLRVLKRCSHEMRSSYVLTKRAWVGVGWGDGVGVGVG